MKYGAIIHSFYIKDTCPDCMSYTEKTFEELRNRERIALQINYRTNIQAFQYIFNTDFNMDTTFEKECYFEDKYLCTVAYG